jgi:hypothetical protein
METMSTMRFHIFDHNKLLAYLNNFLDNSKFMIKLC